MSNTEISTYDRGKRVVLADDAGEVLAQATPCACMAKTVDGKRYRLWLVKVSTPGHKYGFMTVPSRSRAIALMEDPEQRARYQGRPMFDTEA